MSFITLKCLHSIFKFACLVTAILMIIFCCYEFSQNKDVSEVSFVHFNENEYSIYPQITLCLVQPFLEDRLRNYGDGINSSSYTRFLKGEIWDARMVDIDIENVTVKLDDHLLDTCVGTSFDGKCQGKGYTSTHVYPFGPKCLSFHYSNPKRIYFANLWIKNSIFPNGMRPHIKNFPVIITFPQQVLRLSSEMDIWPTRNNASDTYVMHFVVGGVEVIRRRNKPERKCRDWKKYDSIVEEELLSDVGCRPFYSRSLKELVPCDTREKLRDIYRRHWLIMSHSPELGGQTTPCNEIQKMQIEYKEENTNFTKDKEMFPEVTTELKNTDGWFRVTVLFQVQPIKEIKQIRAYTPQSLVGNAGGYVGLLVGYSIAELPVLLGLTYKYMVKIIAGLKKIKGRESTPTISSKDTKKEIDVHELENIGNKVLKLERKFNALELKMERRFDVPDLKLGTKWSSLDNIYYEQPLML